MAKTLYAVDELSGFIAACALVRPTGIEGMKPKSVKKKLKQPSFAAAVDRDQVQRGIEELGRRPRRAHDPDHRGAGRARRRARDRPARTEAGTDGVRRWLKITLGVLAGFIVLLVLNAIAVSNETEDAERERRGRRAGRDLERDDPGAGRGRPARLADRADPRLHGLDALVRRARAAARREPPGDPGRPARPRRLRQAGRRLRDRGPGERDRRGAGRARSQRTRPSSATRSGRPSRPRSPSRAPSWPRGSSIVDQAPDDSYEDLSLHRQARLRAGDRPGDEAAGRRRARPRRSATSSRMAFAPDFNIASGFENPDQVVEDLREMTYTAFVDAADAEGDYTDARAARRAARAPLEVPLLVDLRRRGPDLRRRGGDRALRGHRRRPDRAARGRRPLAQRRGARGDRAADPRVRRRRPVQAPSAARSADEAQAAARQKQRRRRRKRRGRSARPARGRRRRQTPG